MILRLPLPKPIKIDGVYTRVPFPSRSDGRAADIECAERALRETELYPATIFSSARSVWLVVHIPLPTWLMLRRSLVGGGQVQIIGAFVVSECARPF